MPKTTYDYGVKESLARYCKDNRISQVEISTALKVSTRNVNKWFNLRYKTMPPLIVVLYLVRRGLNVNELLGGRG